MLQGGEGWDGPRRCPCPMRQAAAAPLPKPEKGCKPLGSLCSLTVSVKHSSLQGSCTHFKGEQLRPRQTQLHSRGQPAIEPAAPHPSRPSHVTPRSPPPDLVRPVRAAAAASSRPGGEGLEVVPHSCLLGVHSRSGTAQGSPGSWGPRPGGAPVPYNMAALWRGRKRLLQVAGLRRTARALSGTGCLAPACSGAPAGQACPCACAWRSDLLPGHVCSEEGRSRWLAIVQCVGWL